MMSLIAKVIEGGIKRPIRLLIENDCPAAALVLIYSAIDMLSFLDLPASKDDVNRSDFIRWAEMYVVPALPQPISARDLYAARCGVLRGTDSRLVREGLAQRIRYAASKEAHLVMPVATLAEALFTGMDRFVSEAMKDDSRRDLFTKRLDQMAKTLPF